MRLPPNWFLSQAQRDSLVSVVRLPLPPLWRADVGHNLCDRRRVHQRLLGYLGEPTQAPHIAPAARGPLRWEEDFDPREEAGGRLPTPHRPPNQEPLTAAGGLASGQKTTALRVPHRRNLAGSQPKPPLPPPRPDRPISARPLQRSISFAKGN
ncbi:MAG: hypothetical protein ACREYC_18250 [Gammaproteobacteria bacterium]